MDVGRLDDIFKNLDVHVKYGRPRNPVHQNLDVHGLKTCKTWTSNMWIPGRPGYSNQKCGRSNVGTMEQWMVRFFFHPKGNQLCHVFFTFDINASKGGHGATPRLICKTEMADLDFDVLLDNSLLRPPPLSSPQLQGQDMLTPTPTQLPSDSNDIEPK